MKSKASITAMWLLALLPLVLVWYCITELRSIAENAALMGAPIPEWLRKLLEAGKQAVDDAGERLTGEDGEDP